MCNKYCNKHSDKLLMVTLAILNSHCIRLVVLCSLDEPEQGRTKKKGTDK